MSKTYVVRGTWEGKEVFYNVDRDSGYPYASSWSGKETGELREAVDWLEECGANSTYCKMNNPKVCEIQYVPVDVSHLIKYRNKLAEYVKGLSEEERKLLKGLL